MKERNLDGMYFRAKREDGHWESVCLSDMTSEERMNVLSGKTHGFLLSCIDRLCDVLQEIGDEYDIVKE